MYRSCSDPFSQFVGFWSSMMFDGPWGCRRFYSRKERIEHLEEIKKRLGKEIEAIDEILEDLRQRDKNG